MQREFEGERNALESKIASFELQLKDQAARILTLGDQLEKSNVQVQAIAVKAVEGSAAKPVMFSTPQQKRGE